MTVSGVSDASMRLMQTCLSIKVFCTANMSEQIRVSKIKAVNLDKSKSFIDNNVHYFLTNAILQIVDPLTPPNSNVL